MIRTPSVPLHADRNAMGLEFRRKLQAGEQASLELKISVPHRISLSFFMLSYHESIRGFGCVISWAIVQNQSTILITPKSGF